MLPHSVLAVPIPAAEELAEAEASWRRGLPAELAAFAEGGPTFVSINRFERKKVSRAAAEWLRVSCVACSELMQLAMAPCLQCCDVRLAAVCACCHGHGSKRANIDSSP